mmetsp:Transcript_31759/g.84801  ORF Transcript_31759/g.84801 Transcript_31759/m.84801 type:complete len:96 (+) Transcript_31759:658-945(+)
MQHHDWPTAGHRVARSSRALKLKKIFQLKSTSTSNIRLVSMVGIGRDLITLRDCQFKIFIRISQAWSVARASSSLGTQSRFRQSLQFELFDPESS